MTNIPHNVGTGNGVRDGRRSHPLKRTYDNMLYRCLNESAVSYVNYGGRGITVCDRWLGKSGFANFLQDMGTRPDGYTLDRVDNDKGYSPDNCKWSTRTEQARNRRDSTKPDSGITWHKGNCKWQVHITVDNRLRFCGYFKSKEEALSYKQSLLT